MPKVKDRQRSNRRGFYIYGPDFFFLPNRIWQQISENQRVLYAVRDTGLRVAISKNFLMPTLREPSVCGFELIPEAQHRLLVIPPKPLQQLPKGLREYVKVTNRLLGGKIPAKDYYPGSKDQWYSFAYAATREPFGPIVIPEKFRPYHRGVAAHYLSQNETSENQVAVPVSFYTRSTGDSVRNMATVAWLNSTVGLAFRHRDRSWLGAASERMSGKQFDTRLEFLNVNSFSRGELRDLARFVEDVPQELPEISDQLADSKYPGSWRADLDSTVLELLGVPSSKLAKWIDHCRRRVLGWAETARRIGGTAS